MADPIAGTGAEQIIRDNFGKELGKIRQLASGRYAAYDRLGAELGSYDPRTDKTYDRLGLEVGSGNQLRWLISQAWE